MEAQILKKLGLQNHKNLLEKTKELLRLLEIKSSTVSSAPSGINDYAKISICVDLATSLLGISVDLLDVIKQSGLKKTAYEKCKRTFQKILNLNKPLRINEICVHLNCNEVAQKATKLLNLYEDYINKNNDNDVDLSHPQYTAMAIFQACKLNNVKILKPKILGYSHLKPSQWVRLEQQWDKLISKHGGTLQNVNLKSKNKTEIIKDDDVLNQKKNCVQKIEIEDYKVWKTKIIKKAKEEIKQMRLDHMMKDIETLDFDDSF